MAPDLYARDLNSTEIRLINLIHYKFLFVPTLRGKAIAIVGVDHKVRVSGIHFLYPLPVLAVSAATFKGHCLMF